MLRKNTITVCTPICEKNIQQTNRMNKKKKKNDEIIFEIYETSLK